MASEFPIDPSLDEQGRIRALVPLLGDAARPVPLPALDGAWDIDFDARNRTSEISAKLGVSALLATESRVNRTTAIWDALVGKRAIVDTPEPDTVIYETFWGIGLRILLTYRSTDVGLDASIAVVAATAEYRSLDVQYEIRSLGLGAKELAFILRRLPPLGRFDMTSYTVLETARQSLKDSLLAALAQPDAAKRLRPAIIKMAAAPFTGELEEAAEYRFTMQGIAAGLRLNETLARKTASAWKAVRQDEIRKIYRELVGSDGPPDTKAKTAARNWLSAS
ncbi:hypothetical protein ACNOYE_29165 [Nannocystaceae bacterium ST9]